MTTIDFLKAYRDAQSASYEALPVGSYDVEIETASAVRSSNDKPMIKVTMKVIGGPYDRRSVFNNFVLSLENAQAMAIFFRNMKAFGLTEEFFQALGSNGSLEPVAQALVTRRANVTLGHREWQGETRNEVKAIKPYTGAPQMGGPGIANGPGGPSAPGMNMPVGPPLGQATGPTQTVQPGVPSTPQYGQQQSNGGPTPGPTQSAQPQYTQSPSQPQPQPVQHTVPTEGGSRDDASSTSSPTPPTYSDQPQQPQPQPQPPAPPAAPELPF